MNKLNKILSTVLVRGAGALAQVIVFYVVAKSYNPEEASLLYFSISLVPLIIPISLFGFNTFAVKYVSRAKETEEVFDWARLSSGFLLKLNVIFAATLVIAVSFYIELNFTIIMVIFSISLVLSAANFQASLLQGMKSFNASIFISNICFFGALSFLIFLLSRYGITPSINLAISFPISAMLTLLISSVVLSRHLTGRFPVPRLNGAISEVLKGEPIGEVFRFWMIYSLIVASNWVPQLLFYFGGNTSDFSYFSVAQRLANIVIFFNIVASFMLGPYAASMYSNGKISDLKKLFLKLCLFTTACALPFAAFLIYYADVAMSLFGDGYEDGGIYLQIIIGAQIINVATGSANTILIMTGYAKELLVSLILSFLFGFVLSLFLGEHFSGVGYTLGLALTMLLQNAMSFFFVMRGPLKVS